MLKNVVTLLAVLALLVLVAVPAFADPPEGRGAPEGAGPWEPGDQPGNAHQSQAAGLKGNTSTAVPEHVAQGPKTEE